MVAHGQESDVLWALKALAVYCLGSAIVATGAYLGPRLLRPPHLGALPDPRQGRYAQIVAHGYHYDPARASTVAFFPATPAMAWLVKRLLGVEPWVAVMITSNVLAAGCCVVLAAYARCPREVRVPRPEGHGEGPAENDSSRLTEWALLVFAFWPTTFYLRIGGSEPAFLFLCVMTLYGMRRGWPLPFVAFLAGATTATRPVGVAVLVPVALYVLQHRRRWSERLYGLVVFLPLASWGLAAYMLFQHLTFGDALAFVKTQQHWTRAPALPWWEKAVALLSWEPFWASYLPGNAAFYWKDWEPELAICNCRFLNPIYFGAAVALVILGAWRRWLDGDELLLAAGLLLIPYVTKGYDNAMVSHGRFAMAVWPAYLVAGELLRRLPLAVSGSVLGVLGFLLGVYTAVYSAGYPFF